MAKQLVTLTIGETVEVVVGMWRGEDRDFRAAFFAGGDLLLTDETQAHLDDAALLAAGVAQALAI